MTSEPDTPDEVYGVTTLELFFDLVFVFAVTQLTSLLIDEFNPLGMARVVLAFAVLWWMYGGYAWLTNTVRPDRDLFRILLLLGMGGFLVIALATPTAFGSGGVAWGVGYLVVVLVHAGLYNQVNRNIQRALPLNVLAAVAIIVAGLVEHGPLVYVLWTLAVLIPIVATLLIAIPESFSIRPKHIVERHGLAVLITFGESIVAIGIGAAGLDLDAALITAALLGLALVATLWWTYFTGDDERAETALAAADPVRRTAMTLNGYFYAHIPIVVGVIAVAAGLKKAVGHPGSALHLGPALALGGGLALYLAGTALFRWIMGIGPSRLRLAGAAAALALTPVGELNALAELAALLVVTTAVLTLERRTAGREVRFAG